MRKRQTYVEKTDLTLTDTLNSKCRVRLSQKRLSYYLHSQPCLRHVTYHMLYPEVLNYLSFRYFLYWFCAIFLPTPPYYQFLFLWSSNILPNSTAAPSTTLILFTCRFLCSTLDHGLALERDICFLEIGLVTSFYTQHYVSK